MFTNHLAGISILMLVSLLSILETAMGDVELLANGNCPYRIVIGSEASLSERHAATEFQTYFEKCTGVNLPIIDDPQASSPVIIIGSSDLAERHGVNPTHDLVGEQGCIIKTDPPDIIIAGSPEAGTLYGVHRFLEEYLGVRWYAPGVTKTPLIRNLTIPDVEKVVKPAFLYRHTSYSWPGKDAAFLARVGDNHGYGDADNPYGIQYGFMGVAHSYFWFVSPDEYFDEHPEYFSEIGGKRRRRDTQLCLTNPDVFRIVLDKMLQFMEEKPNLRQFSFSQMDYYNYCECPECAAINEKYGTPGGTQYWFVNKLAAETSKRFPDKLISTLAYTYTEEPPKNMVMHPNVCVWLCHMYPSCDSHPIESCPKNADFKRRAIEWSKICSHLYVWHYIVDFAHYYVPFPNFEAMAADMRFYHEIGVEGVFLQGMGERGGGGEFSLLRPYYGMKLLWDPDRNPDEIIDDFLQGYYGDAWRPIRDYIDLLHDKVRNENIHMHLYTNPAQGYLSDDIIARSIALFDDAEKRVSDDPELLERVCVARMPLTYARLFPRNGYRIENGHLSFLGDIASPLEVTEFIGRMKRHGFTSIRESDSGEMESLEFLHSVLQSGLDVVTIGNDRLSIDIVPGLAGRALRIIERATNQCVTAYNTTRSLLFPFCGGMEDRVGEQFRSYGWMEPAILLDHDDRSATIAISDTGRFKEIELRRTISVDPDNPIIRVKSTLINKSDKTQEERLRNHLELSLGSLDSVRFSFTNLAGDEVDRDLRDVIRGLREGERFAAGEAPAGCWTFLGDKGLILTQKFNNEQIDYVTLCAYPEELGVLDVELWGKRVTLKPGESFSIEQEISIGGQSHGEQ